ncbi:MAG: hypothetical protein M3P84_11640 [Chloroflexota bacterium]|nr:hypothetical protein [Chloroflexota bacterium]
MERSIAQGPSSDAGAIRPPGTRPGTGATVAVGLAITALLLGIYVFSNPHRDSYYNHFVWQAEAFLEGRAAIRYPVHDGPLGRGNDLFQDVVLTIGPHGEPSGYALLPFPPLPAVVLMPFVAIWGLATDAQLVAAILGALDVAIAFWVLGRLPISSRVRVATTLFLGLGTVLWYAAELGTTWYLAHVVAVGLTLLAIGVALSRDPIAAAGDPDPDSSPRRRRIQLDRGQVLAGFLLGLACTARLTMVFGLPFLVLVGGGGDRLRRGASALVGMAIPLGLLLAYTYITTGHLLNPGYEILYRVETAFYPGLGYRADWAIEDPRYLVQNLPLLLVGPPTTLPACAAGAVPGLFDPACPLAVPRDVGMGLFLTSPAWLVAFASLRWWGRDRLVTGAAIAVGAIAIVDLMHFSQGWVQFGYRFSNDYAPFGLILLALALEAGRRLRRLGYVLIAISIAIVGWGVTWGHLLGW